MMSSSSTNKSERTTSIRRLIMVAACLLMVVLIVSVTGFLHRGVVSMRFEALQLGMTQKEVDATLDPRLRAQMISAPEEGPNPIRRTIRFGYAEDPVFPGFVATVTFLDGHLEEKELQKPTLGEIIKYWWSRVRRE
jgi:hypothetical protein